MIRLTLSQKDPKYGVSTDIQMLFHSMRNACEFLQGYSMCFEGDVFFKMEETDETAVVHVNRIIDSLSTASADKG